MSRRDTGVLRRPTVGEAVEQLVSQGVIVGVGAAVVGVTGSPLLWWAVAAVMAIVGARGLRVLLEPPARLPRGVGVYPIRHQGASTYGAAASSTGYSSFGGGLDGGGGGGDGGGC